MSVAHRFLLPFLYFYINRLIYCSLNPNKEMKLKITVVHDSAKWIDIAVGYVEMNLKNIRDKTIDGEGTSLAE